MYQDLVRQWMTEITVSVPPTASLEEVAQLMDESNVRRLTVVNGDELIGIVSLGDIREAKAAATAGQDQPISTIMTEDPITISIDATVALAAETMLQLKVSGLPVVDDDGALCGVLSESDLFRYIVEVSKETSGVEWEVV